MANSQLVLVLIFWGSIENLSTVFAFADITMTMLAFVNLFALAFLFKIAMRILKDYDDSPDGQMQLLEFAALVEDLNKGMLRASKKEDGDDDVSEMILNIFDKFDTDASGSLKYTELRSALTFCSIVV